MRGAIHDMAAALLVVGNEVQMISWNIDTIPVPGKSEARHGAPNVLQLEFGLMLEGFLQCGIWLFLPGYASDPDLRESGSIEQDSDVVILLHREDAYEPESPRAGEADFIVAKHRNGPTATVTVAFQGHYSRFVDMARI